DLIHFLPGSAQPRPEFEVPAQRADIHGPARSSLGILQIESGAEGIGAAGQHHDRGIAVVLEAARCVGELAQGFRRQRVDAVTAVEAHDSDPPLGSQAPFDGYKIRQIPLPARFFEHTAQSSGANTGALRRRFGVTSARSRGAADASTSTEYSVYPRLM